MFYTLRLLNARVCFLVFGNILWETLLQYVLFAGRIYCNIFNILINLRNYRDGQFTSHNRIDYAYRPAVRLAIA